MSTNDGGPAFGHGASNEHCCGMSLRILVSGATLTVKELADSGHVGHLLVPGAGNDIAKFRLPWAADNGAFSGLDAPAFLRMLAAILKAHTRPLFVTVPDKVGDAAETNRLWRTWAPMMREIGLPLAYVSQDGANRIDIPWNEFEALFVGGTDLWKYSPESLNLMTAAKQQGKHLHVGRVNTQRALRACIDMDVDTVDGTSWSRWPDTNLISIVQWLRGEVRQGVLHKSTEKTK